MKNNVYFWNTLIGYTNVKELTTKIKFVNLDASAVFKNDCGMTNIYRDY